MRFNHYSWIDKLTRDITTWQDTISPAMKITSAANKSYEQFLPLANLEVLENFKQWQGMSINLENFTAQIAPAMKHIRRFSAVNSMIDRVALMKAYHELEESHDTEPRFWETTYDLVPDQGVEENKTAIVAIGDRVSHLIRSVYDNNELLYTVDPRDFEQMISEILKAQGYQVELTKQTRDGGYDIIALKNLMGDPIKFLIECKRFAKKNAVDVKIVREFMYVVGEEKANKGLIVTSSYFSSIAVEEAKKHPYKLGFKDNADVIDWAGEYLRVRN